MLAGGGSAQISYSEAPGNRSALYSGSGLTAICCLWVISGTAQGFLGLRLVSGICARLRRCPQDLMVVQGVGVGGGFLHVTEWHAGVETAVMNACRDLLLVVPKSA
jgi:hypothetical protein